MCGIAGVLDFRGRPASASVLAAMTGSLAHRGPDGEDFLVEGGFGLGHRRLAVLDLSAAARQPMATPDGRWVISYNGELYNFRELRRALEACGHVFQSTGDTEVVLRALAQWGPSDALLRFNGMFALALWDRRERRLLLARDRFGIKPLYHAVCNGAMLFASEIKAFLTHPDFSVTVDEAALLEYFTFQNYFTNRTLFSGVDVLPAGTFLEADENGHIKTTRYWDVDFRCSSDPERAERDEEGHLEELDRLFHQAVKRQLVSDVPLGCYLSGGMDTGAITAVAAGDIPGMNTFTVGFDLRSATGIELGYDERPQAEHMSAVFGTEHYEIVLKAGDMERAMADVIWHIEEPRIGQSYPNFYAAKLASRFVKVVLSGAGGDELFGGYPWRYYRAAESTDFLSYVDSYYQFWHRLLSVDDIRRLFQPIWPRVSHVSTRDIFRNTFTNQGGVLTSPEDYVNKSLYLEAKTFLHGLLVVDDKLSMARGLEVRQPFLDNDLADFAMGLPPRFKLRRLDRVIGFDENTIAPKLLRYNTLSYDGKIILRKAMARHMPQTIVEAAKQGFVGPDASWFRGDSIKFVRRTLLEREPLLSAFFDRDTVRRLVEDHLEGRENRRLLIWSLLCFENWLAIFVEGRRPARPASWR